jgi:hypothetical protein
MGRDGENIFSWLDMNGAARRLFANPVTVISRRVLIYDDRAFHSILCFCCKFYIRDRDGKNVILRFPTFDLNIKKHDLKKSDLDQSITVHRRAISRANRNEPLAADETRLSA